MQLLIIFGDLRCLFLAISCFAENQKSKSTDQYMLHSSGQIKACMTSKQYTFENNVTFHFDRKTVLQYEKKPCICVFRRKKVAIR